MGWNIVQTNAGTFELRDDKPGATGGVLNPSIALGRGTTDTDITWLSLRNAAGTRYYIYVSATGALTAATAIP